MIALALIAAGVAADIVTSLYDAKQTEKGLAKGVAVEANSIVDKLAGTNKPGFDFVFGESLAKVVLIAVVGLLALKFTIWALVGGAIGFFLADAGKHIIGGRNWAYLMKGGNPNPNQRAFQKFIGLLSWNRD